MTSTSENSATPAEPTGTTAGEDAAAGGNIGPYSWEIIHDGETVTSGAVDVGAPHPWTGDTGRKPAYEVGNELFEWACESALEQSRDAIVEARVEGRVEPAPPAVVAVRLRDAGGTEVVSMTARLTHLPVTEADLDCYRNMLDTWAAEERELTERRRREGTDEA